MDIKNPPTVYDHIELSEEETQLAIKWGLYEMRRTKAGRSNLESYKKKIMEPKVYPLYTAEQLMQLLRSGKTSKGEQIVIDEWNEEIAWKMCLYFSSDVRCQSEKIDLKKGIYIVGPVGCGKSQLFDFFKKNQKDSYIIVPADVVAEDYQKMGDEGIMRYKNPMRSTLENEFGHRELGICFDDIGTEVSQKHFGNESNVVANILLSRYRNPFFLAKTHVTTNLSSDELERRYTDRVKSRLREMMNVFVFDENAPDRRK